MELAMSRKGGNHTWRNESRVCCWIAWNIVANAALSSFVFPLLLSALNSYLKPAEGR